MNDPLERPLERHSPNADKATPMPADIRTYKAHLDAEPPVKTIVVDKDGFAWQRVKSPSDIALYGRGTPEWRSTRPGVGGPMHWSSVLITYGPVIEMSREEAAES